VEARKRYIYHQRRSQGICTQGPSRGGGRYGAVVLDTTGRNSGERLSSRLFTARRHGYIVVRSKGGRRRAATIPAVPQHPGQHEGVFSPPEVQAGTTKTKERARTATGEERAKMWEGKGHSQFWPHYDDTERRASARFPSWCSPGG